MHECVRSSTFISLSLRKLSDQVSSQAQSCLFLIYLFFQHLHRTSLKCLIMEGLLDIEQGSSRALALLSLTPQSPGNSGHLVSAPIMLTIPTFVPYSQPIQHGLTNTASEHSCWTSESRDMSLSFLCCALPYVPTHIQPHPGRSIPHHAAHSQGHLTPLLQLDIMRTPHLATASKSLRSNQSEDKVVSNLVTSAVEPPDYHVHNHNRNEAK